MLSDNQLAQLPRPVRILVHRLTSEQAWQQIATLMAMPSSDRLKLACVMAGCSDRHGRYFGEISVAKSQ